MSDSDTLSGDDQIVLEDLTEDNVHLVKRLNQVGYTYLSNSGHQFNSIQFNSILFGSQMHI